MVGILEKNGSDLSVVYSSFNRLFTHFRQNESISEVVQNRWNFLHTESMGFAYLLSPATKGGEDMVHNDRSDTIKQLKSYINVFFTAENDRNFATEDLEKYLSKYAYTEVRSDGCSPGIYWSVYG